MYISVRMCTRGLQRHYYNKKISGSVLLFLVKHLLKLLLSTLSYTQSAPLKRRRYQMNFNRKAKHNKFLAIFTETVSQLSWKQAAKCFFKFQSIFTLANWVKSLNFKFYSISMTSQRGCDCFRETTLIPLKQLKMI